MNVKIDEVIARSLSVYSMSSNRGAKGNDGREGRPGRKGDRGPPGKCCDIMDGKPVVYIQKGGKYQLYDDDDCIIVDSPTESVTLLADQLLTLSVSDAYSVIHIRPKKIIVSPSKKSHYIETSDPDKPIVIDNAGEYILCGINGKWWCV